MVKLLTKSLIFKFLIKSLNLQISLISQSILNLKKLMFQKTHSINLVTKRFTCSALISEKLWKYHLILLQKIRLSLS